MEVARARAGVLQPRARPPGKEEDDRGRAVGLGQQVGCLLGRPGKWPRYNSLSPFYYCFLFLLQLLGFIKNTKTFPKILQIIVGSVGFIPNILHLSSELIEHLK